MSPELKEAIERVRHHKMTPEEMFEQRVSFVYGQCADSGSSKDEVRAHLAEMYGDPAAIRREARRQAIEECAKVAEGYPSPLDDLPMAMAVRGIAQAIRSLAAKEESR